MTLQCNSQITLKASLHMGQEPWPCNGEDPWLSSEGRTMGVGKTVVCSHGPSRIVWSENGPCCGTTAYFGWRKKRGWFALTYYVSNSINLRESLSGVCLSWYPRISLVRKDIQEVMVSRNLCQAHLLEVGLTKFPRNHESLSIIHHVGLHVDFSSMKSSLGLHLRVWSELGGSPPFWPMRALRLQWSWAFSLVCEVALTMHVAQLGISFYHKIVFSKETTSHNII